MMLSRKVVTRSKQGFHGYFPSRKLRRLVQFESMLEKEAISKFENAKEVKSYREQPMVIYYYDKTIQKKYYPDFELHLNNGCIVHIEIKPSGLLNASALKKYRAISQTYSKRPEGFAILTEFQLRNPEINKDFYKILRNNNLVSLRGDQS